MSNLSQTKKVLIVSYIVFLIGAFLYVSYVIRSGGTIKVDDKETQKKVTVKPADVYLNLHQGNTLQNFKVRLNNTDTVFDLLENLRVSKKINYDKTEYSYGTEIDEINGIKAPEGYKWKIYKGLISQKNDLTHKISEEYLNDNDIYELVLEKE